MFIEYPDKDVALKLAVCSAEYTSNLRNTWLEKSYNIILETVQFINEVYTHSREYQIASIADKSLAIFGFNELKNEFYIYDIYVDESARGMHYGKELLMYIIKYWRKNYSDYSLTLSVDKNNYNAINFYKLNKFEIIELEGDTSYKMEYMGK